MLENIFYLNKLRKYLGLGDAIKAFSAIRLAKTGKIKVKTIKYPFKIRAGNNADSSTFNEVILRKEYTLNLQFTPKTIIDGGANIGLTSLFFINQYPDSQIIAIEPATDNYGILKENVSPYLNVIPIQSAIWSGKTNLKVIDNGRGANGYTVEEAKEVDKDTFTAIGIVDIMKKQNWERIDILKLDIEGSEKQVFEKDYEYWLPRTKVLIVETHDRFVKGSSKAVFATVSKYNFSCRLQGFNLVFYNEDLN